MFGKYKNILIIKPSALGDIVTALPALSILRKSFKDAKISWLVRPEFSGLLEGHPYIDELIIFDRKVLGSAWRSAKGAGELFRLIRKLRGADFDAIADFQGLFRSAVFSWLSGCKRRYGMSSAREFAPLFYTDKVEQKGESVHVVDYYLQIAGAMGANEGEADFVLAEDPKAKAKVVSLLEQNGVDEGYAVFIPGSAQMQKCWPADRFSELARRITSELGLKVVITGTAGERELGEKIAERADCGVVNLAGKTGLKELVAVLKDASVVVTNDTGPGHIAGAAGVGLVMIFGPSNPIRIYPYGRADTLAAVEPFERGMALWSDDPAHSIEAISVDLVYGKVCEQLNKKQGCDGEGR